jgi:putative radical SAM enzyme (TIGR03279 family)
MTAKRAVEQGHGGLVTAVRPGSPAAETGIRPGDRLTAVNGNPVEDVIDVQFHAAEDILRLQWTRGGRALSGSAARPAGIELGLDFAHPTFDTDIRRCNNRCPFCFVVQMAPGMRRTLHIKDDDYRYSFLYGHFVTLTNLSRRDWDRIVRQRLSPLYVSVHATDPELRAHLLGNPNAGDILDRLRFLADGGIEIHTQAVLVPGVNDGAQLDRTLSDLAALHPAVRSCSVVPVGVTRYQKHGIRPYAPAAMREVIQQVEEREREFLARIGSRFAFLTDEWYLAAGMPIPPPDSYEQTDLRENGVGLVRGFLEDWEAVRRRLAGRRVRFRHKKATLVTASLFGRTLGETAAECTALTGIVFHVIAVPNRCFGETVTVAGLLTGRDAVDAVLSAGKKGPVLLPSVLFGGPEGLSLDDMTPRAFAEAVGADAALVDTMSDVLDILRTGKRAASGLLEQ